MKKIISTLCILMAFGLMASAPTPEYSFKVGLVQYNGGGDWYANKETSLPNLVKYCNRELDTNIDPDQEIVEVGSLDLFNLPFIHMTGHGNIVFSDDEAKNLKRYLESGGFLHIDDNYGMDPYIRAAMKQVFPNQEFTEVPFSHPIFNQHYRFTRGVPKIHEHEGQPAQGFGLFVEDRLVCFYTYESDLGDGWESPEVHNDPEPVRKKALQMGANIIQFALTQ